MAAYGTSWSFVSVERADPSVATPVFVQAVISMMRVRGTVLSERCPARHDLDGNNAQLLDGHTTDRATSSILRYEARAIAISAMMLSSAVASKSRN